MTMSYKRVYASMLSFLTIAMSLFSALTPVQAQANSTLATIIKAGKIGAGLVATAVGSAGITKIVASKQTQEAMNQAVVDAADKAAEATLIQAQILQETAVQAAITRTTDEIAQATAEKLVQEELAKKAAEEAAKWAIWNNIKGNSAQAISNMGSAMYNVLTLVPRGVKYVAERTVQELAEEAKIVSEQLKTCPALTVALVAGTSYLVWKRYKMVQKEKNSVLLAQYARMKFEETTANAGFVLSYKPVRVRGPHTPAVPRIRRDGARELGRERERLATADMESLYNTLILAEENAGNPRITGCGGTALRFCGII